MNQPTKQSFLKDVENHQLTIIKDDGLYRHIRLKQPNTGCMYFDIVTWPGHLAYTGDMGTYTFSRTEDMFMFFRNDSDDWGINPGYWKEKVQSESIFGDGVSEYDHDAIIERLLTYRDEFIEDKEDLASKNGVDIQDEIDEATDAVDAFIYSCENSEWDAVSRINNWDDSDAGGMGLDDFWCDFSPTRGTFHYLWCCYSIVWAIRQYDAAIAVREAS